MTQEDGVTWGEGRRRVREQETDEARREPLDSKGAAGGSSWGARARRWEGSLGPRAEKTC